MLHDTAQLVRSRTWAVAAIILGLIGVICAFFGLVGSLGYESAVALSLPAFFIAAMLGHHAEARPAAPPVARAPLIGPTNAFGRFSAVVLSSWGALLAPFAVLAVTALWRPQCDWADALAWWALIPAGAMPLGAALGMLLGAWLPRRPKTAGALVVGLVILSLARFGLRLADGPVLFAYNHVFGYFPGPLYDDVLPIPAGLLYLRAITLGISASLVAWIHLRRVRTLEAAVGLAALIVVTGVLWSGRKHFKLDFGRPEVQESLGGKLETDHFVIYWDRNGGISEDDITDLAGDHEYRYDQLAEFLEIEPTRKITSYVFANRDRKKELAGAAGTQVANPYRREIYIDSPRVPHPVLKHELVHAFSGDFGWPVLGYSTQMGLIEGIAVAADWTSSGRRNPHREAAAMLADGDLPDPGRLMWITSFYAERQSKAYSTMGSFVRFLVERYGMTKFREVYPWARFRQVYGKSVEELTSEWHEFLKTIEVDEGERKAYRERFAAPSIFEQPCARRVAELAQQAWTAYGRGQLSRAQASFEALAEIDDSPKAWRGLTLVYLRWKKYEAARTALDAWLSRENPGSAGELRARIVEGDLLWATDDLERAADTWREVLAANLSPHTNRELAVKLASVSDPVLTRELRTLFLGGDSYDAARLRLDHADRASSPAGTAGSYMMGRHFLFEREPQLALRYLYAADQPDVTEPAWSAELYLSIGRALWRLDRCPEAIDFFHKAQQVTNVPYQQAGRAADWIERCEWSDLKHEP